MKNKEKNDLSSWHEKRTSQLKKKKKKKIEAFIEFLFSDQS